MAAAETGPAVHRRRGGELTPIELQEVAAFDRALRRAGQPRLTPRQRCLVTRMPADRKPTELELVLIDLNCSGK